ncbi:MAG: DUF465 domain-containing protein [Alphaproteobacteria bacterium]|nr:DUF465 domain-containing protein [Alphaproteobacteria bacterium]
MKTPSEFDGSARKELQRKLIELREEHRDLDQAIAALVEPGDLANQIRIQRLKKRKLALKDQIAQIESALLPDIIA